MESEGRSLFTQALTSVLRRFDWTLTYKEIIKRLPDLNRCVIFPSRMTYV